MEWYAWIMGVPSPVISNDPLPYTRIIHVCYSGPNAANKWHKWHSCAVQIYYLGGGFKHFWCSSLPGEMIQFWLIFFRWVETTTKLFIHSIEDPYVFHSLELHTAKTQLLRCGICLGIGNNFRFRQVPWVDNSHGFGVCFYRGGSIE